MFCIVLIFDNLWQADLLRTHLQYAYGVNYNYTPLVGEESVDVLLDVRQAILF
jgi:hypothetical protein